MSTKGYNPLFTGFLGRFGHCFYMMVMDNRGRSTYKEMEIYVIYNVGANGGLPNSNKGDQSIAPIDSFISVIF
jgi:hypothetical protein